MALVSILTQALGFDRATRTKFQARRPVRVIEGEEDFGYQEILELDATISQNHNSEVVPTEHPIEDGSIVGDHIQKRPKTLTIEGVVSDTPITLTASGISLLTSGGIAVGGKLGGGLLGAAAGTAAGSIGGLLGTASDRARTAYLYMLALQEQQVTFSMVTGLKVYENMVLKSLSVPITSQTGNSIQFTAEMQEITIVDSEIIFLPELALSKDISATGAKQTNQGKKNTKGASDDVSDKATESFARSGLRNIINAGSALFGG